jgi:hypothetical protein
MSFAAALILAASAAFTPAPAMPGAGSGAQVASAQARATIVKAVVVRQATGLQEDRDGPVPQISRQGRSVLIEFQ